MERDNQAVKQWNPRYVAYANSQGKSPEDMLVVDAARYPGGKMAGFLIWSSGQLYAFKQEHPEAFRSGGLFNHPAYDAWLAQRWNGESTGAGSQKVRL